jgi:hypothetical protein
VELKDLKADHTLYMGILQAFNCPFLKGQHSIECGISKTPAATCAPPPEKVGILAALKAHTTFAKFHLF